jgi:hypothetical protein
MKHFWNTTIRYLKHTPDRFLADDTENLYRQIDQLAKDNLKAPHTLEFDDYTDELCVHLVRGARRRVFVNVQYEGRQSDV